MVIKVIKNIDNKIKKIVILAIIFMAIFVPISNAFTIDDIITQGDQFIKDGEGNQLLDEQQLKTNVDQIYDILLTIGVALSVLVGAILGIKYIVGSVEEQAKIKETLIPYIIGCVVVFGAFGIWRLVINLGQEALGATTYIATNVLYMI